MSGETNNSEKWVFVTYFNFNQCCSFNYKCVIVSAKDKNELRKKLMNDKNVLSQILSDNRGRYMPNGLSFISNVEDECEFYELIANFQGDILDFPRFQEYYQNHDILDELENNDSEDFYTVFYGNLEDVLKNKKVGDFILTGENECDYGNEVKQHFHCTSHILLQL